MLSKILIIALLLSVVLISGCTQPVTDGTGGLTQAEIEEQGILLIESEMESAIEGITLEEIEGSIPG